MGRTGRRINITSVRRDVVACRRCTLAGECGPPVPIEGPRAARWAVLVEHPGSDGAHLSERERSMLDKFAVDAGLSLDDAAVLSAVACRPGAQRAVKRAEVAACATNRSAQIDAADVEVVVVVGNGALQSLRADLTVSRTHGRPFRVPGSDGPTYVATYHPRATARRSSWATAVVDDLRVVANLLAGAASTPTAATCSMCGKPTDGADRVDTWGLPVCDDCPTMHDDATAGTGEGPLRGPVEVLVDDSGRVGALAYKVPRSMTLHRGDAVNVPFGSRDAHGVVIGPAEDPSKATKAVAAVLGARSRSAELDIAVAIARENFCDVAKMARRIAPSRGRGKPPIDAGPVVVADVVEGRCPPLPGDDGPRRRYLLCAPGVDTAAVAASEATRLSRHGQVLVLAPTGANVGELGKLFESGAARLDTKAPDGAWAGFRDGSVSVGIGTRSAALYSAANLAGIVVVDEEHPGHVEASMPYTHARDVATRRAVAHHCPLVVIGRRAEPAALGSQVRVVAVGRSSDWPATRVVDRDEFPPHQQMLPPTVRAAATRAVKAGRDVVCVARERQRRCASCGDERPCAGCGSDRCTHRDGSPCPRCGGIGVTGTYFDAGRVAATLGESTRLVSPAELATLKVPGALIILPEIDSTLAAWDLIPGTSAERQLHAALTATGPTGAVWVVTRRPRDPLLVDLMGRHDQVAVAKRAYAGAKAAALPPFGRLVTITTRRDAAPRVDRWPGVVHGPERNHVGEWEILVRIEADALGTLEPHLARLRRGGKVRVTVQ